MTSYWRNDNNYVIQLKYRLVSKLWWIQVQEIQVHRNKMQNKKVIHFKLKNKQINKQLLRC